MCFGNIVSAVTDMSKLVYLKEIYFGYQTLDHISLSRFGQIWDNNHSQRNITFNTVKKSRSNYSRTAMFWMGLED